MNIYLQDLKDALADPKHHPDRVTVAIVHNDLFKVLDSDRFFTIDELREVRSYIYQHVTIDTLNKFKARTKKFL